MIEALDQDSRELVPEAATRRRQQLLLLHAWPRPVDVRAWLHLEHVWLLKSEEEARAL